MSNNRFHVAAACLGLAGAICVPEMAAAQQAQSDDPDPNVTIADRPREDYDPLGIRAGSFFIFPSISLSGTYDSNAFATNDNEDSDVGAILAPRVDVNSNWSRHALNFSAGAVGAAWAEYSENDYLDAFAASTGRLDITRGGHRHGHPAVRPAARGSRRSGRKRHHHDRHQRSRQSDPLLSRPARRPVPAQFRPVLHGGGRRRPAVVLRRYRRPRE